MKHEIEDYAKHDEINEKFEIQSIQNAMSASGYSQKAIEYFIKKPHLGIIPDADISSEFKGSCGDIMRIYLKIDNGVVVDAKYQVMGCAGALTSAMAVVDLIKGKDLKYAQSIDDGTVFKLLEQVPEKKHHCIQLSVKALEKALKKHLKLGR